MEVSRFCSKKTAVKEVTTLDEAIEIAEECDVTEIVILPPESGELDTCSDEEGNDDDGDRTSTFPEPTGRIEVAVEEESLEHAELCPSSSKKSKMTTKMPPVQWVKNEKFFTSKLSSAPVPQLEHEHSKLKDMTPYRLWKTIFNNEVLDLLVSQTNLYANREKNNRQFQVTRQEMKVFVGIILFSGYHSVPHERHYWSTQEDLAVHFVSNVISQNRFLDIKEYLHLADNQKLVKGNKVAKVAPFYNLLNINLQQFGIWDTNLSIAAIMVPYPGHHETKTFIRRKPIRSGFKIWTMCSTSGFPYKMDIYTGQNLNRCNEPLASQVVNSMIKVVEQKSDLSCHHLFFNDFFTSYTLLSELAVKGVKATGAIHSSQTANGQQKLNVGKQRGSYDYVASSSVFICQWNNHSTVNVASNTLTHQPLNKLKHHVKGENEQVHVMQPHLIHQYNQFVGGVDLLDWLLGAYRPSIKAKKWWFPLFANAVNVSVVAAWRLFCALHPLGSAGYKSHLQFLREIIVGLLKKETLQKKGGHHVPLLDDIRYDNVEHPREITTQGRCYVCKKNTKIKCAKCNVRLHRDRGATCFDEYHLLKM